MDTFTINEKDNVFVELSTGQKYALKDIASGEAVIKYGFSVGCATRCIKAGEAVHTDNMKTGLDGLLTYEYCKKEQVCKSKSPFMIDAYVRKDGSIGIRNDIWIINTVGCVNNTAKKLSEITGAFCFPHPYGCSQLGDDLKITQKILCGLIKHPNAGGVLVLGLGCENNNIDEMKKALCDFDSDRIRFLNVQECTDEIAMGVEIINELTKIASMDKRKKVPVSMLKLGLKCGGSDGLSGITANPAVGRVTDELCSMGACAVLTEVPEMFGAETVLFERCVNKKVFEKSVELINSYKKYFLMHNQPVCENPSPGNKAGGITTLEEKSLGCVQKGGSAPVVDVLGYGDTAKEPGLSLLEGPGNDIVSITNLTAAGCQLILFTTGRGTPLGAPVPTVKISSNDIIYKRKPHWIDFNACGFEREEISERLIEYIKEVCNGAKTNNEKYGYREIAVFKDGVTL